MQQKENHLQIKETEAVDDADDAVVDPFFPSRGAQVSLLAHRPPGHGKPMNRDGQEEPVVKDGGAQEQRHHTRDHRAGTPQGLERKAFPSNPRLVLTDDAHGTRVRRYAPC